MSTLAVAHLTAADRHLARVIEQVGPCTFAPNATGTHFASVARAIVFQQLSGKAAGTIYGRFEKLFAAGVPTPGELLALSEAQLRGVGLSGQKTAYLRDLAARSHSGALPIDTLHTLADDAVIAALTQIKGVGRWTAQMFLMFRLGRPDVLPADDLGIRKAVMTAYRMRAMPDPARVAKVGAKWAPHRTIACWYLWRSLDNGGGQL